MRSFASYGSALVLVVACSAGGSGQERSDAPGEASAVIVEDATAAARELGATSDVVVVGKVWRTRVLEQGPGGEPGIHTQVTLMAYRTLSGAVRQQVSFWVQGGRLGQRLRRVSGQARFERGEEVLVFLAADAAGNFWPTSMDAGKWRLERRAAGWRVVTTPVDAGATFERAVSVGRGPRELDFTSLLLALGPTGGSP